MIKKYSIVFVIVSFLFSCNGKHSTEYATISGLIANNEASEVSIMSRGYKKTITVNPDGTFSDTIKINKPGYHTFYDAKNKTILHIKNGNDVHISYDYKDFNNSLSFTGEGSETSNYIIKKQKFDREGTLRNLKSFFRMNKSDFDVKILEIETKLNTLLASPKIDSTLKAQEITKNNRIIDYLKSNYTRENRVLTALVKGKPSPKFVNYENYKGTTTSLDDFKGKYIYIDVWATWCGPCKKETPYLKKLIAAYKSKNIAFIGISVDDVKRHKTLENARNKWKAMVKDKQMPGIQLFADKAWQSDFIRAYGITGIPRFILIDPEGNIIDANAPRPSQERLKAVLNSLSI